MRAAIFFSACDRKRRRPVTRRIPIEPRSRLIAATARCNLEKTRRMPDLEFADETRRCFDHKLARQLDGHLPESADRLHRLQQISTVAGARRTRISIIALIQVVDGLWARIHPQLANDRVEDARVNIAGRRLNGNLVTNTPQKGVVDQVLGIEVRRENGRCSKGLRILAKPGGKSWRSSRENQRLAPLGLRAAKSSIRKMPFALHAGALVEVPRHCTVEHAQGQFAARDHDRPMDANPAWVDGAGVEQPPDR